MVKEAQGSGGYGMLVGPTASRDERERFRQRILDGPERFIAQPTLALSLVPTFSGNQLVDRHVDLRPYVLSGTECSLCPGGFDRCQAALAALAEARPAQPRGPALGGPTLPAVSHQTGQPRLEAHARLRPNPIRPKE